MRTCRPKIDTPPVPRTKTVCPGFIGFKPYERDNYILWGLNKLCNTKKHCALVPTAFGMSNAHFSARAPLGMLDCLFQGWDPQKREMVIAAVPVGFNPQHLVVAQFFSKGGFTPTAAEPNSADIRTAEDPAAGPHGKGRRGR